MRRINKIKRAIVVAGIGLMLGSGGFNMEFQAHQSGAKRPNHAVVHNHFVGVQQPESPPRKIEGDWDTLDARGCVSVAQIERIS